MVRLLSVGFFCAAIACGGSSSNKGNNKSTVNCNATLSGAVSTTLSCAVASLYDANGGDTGWTITGPGLHLAVDLSGQLTTGTFGDASSRVVNASALYLPSGSNSSWVESLRFSAPDKGAMSLVVTSIGTAVTESGGTAYQDSHGTYDATLTPVTASGATGDVTVHVVF